MYFFAKNAEECIPWQVRKDAKESVEGVCITFAKGFLREREAALQCVASKDYSIALRRYTKTDQLYWWVISLSRFLVGGLMGITDECAV